MRTTQSATIAALASLTLLPELASANLALSHNPNATISALSAQLLDHPRSAAGNRKNIWDCDPPEAAVSGTQYFYYGYDEFGNPQPAGSMGLGFRGITPGPGYTITTAEVLTQHLDEPPLFIPVTPSTSYADPNNPFSPQGNRELGLMRFSFALVDITKVGDITDPTDSGELDYDGAPDGVGGFIRGVEHARLFTETYDGHGDDIIRGTMTTIAPDYYSGFAGDLVLDPGHLQFPNSVDSVGGDVSPASVEAVPEPAALAAIGVAGLLALRRRRR